MRHFSIAIFIIVSSNCFGQEWINVTQKYIKNPSFEEYTSCPTSNSNYPTEMWVDSVVGWYTPTQGTSDYFNVCNNYIDGGLNGIPYNHPAKYQPSFHGEGYCGFLAYAIWDNQMWCEYIQTKLIENLEKNSRYKFSMRINRANDYNFSVQNIGAHFSKSDMINMNKTSPYNLNPTILNQTGFLNDTLNWTLITGEFIAKGNESYLTIGWFGDTITSDYHWFIPPLFDSETNELLYLSEIYYLVDSINLYQKKYSLESFNINILTTNNDGLNDYIDFSFYQLKEFEFVVLNRWGNTVFYSNNNKLIWRGTTKDGMPLKDGVYFYKIHAILNDGNEINLHHFITIIN